MPLPNNDIDFKAANIQTIYANWLLHKNISLDVLRLDKIHPVISGNKWFKLQHYLHEAQQLVRKVVTFGGAYSNHIVATAYACKQAGIPCFGIIRGEKPSALSLTLQHAVEYGMELKFVTRELYREVKENHKQALPVTGKKYSTGDVLVNILTKDIQQAEKTASQIIKNEPEANNRDDLYIIPEGGYGLQGAKGAAEIGRMYDLSAYTHIIAGVGTGTMLAGLLLTAKNSQHIVGISSMKGNTNLEQEVLKLVKNEASVYDFSILHDYHFGGFGKHPQTLIDYISEVYKQHDLPLDIVYTGKVFYAINDLADKNYFPENARLLMIHSGGLQGNASIS